MALDTAQATARLDTLVEAIDLDRLALSQELDPSRRAELGQFLTPAEIARQLAAMLSPLTGDVRILDPGAGIGTLGAAVIARLLAQHQRPESITLCSYEIADVMWPGLQRTVNALSE